MHRAIVLLLLSTPLAAQTTRASSAVPGPPAAVSLIREADLKRDLYALAGDEMRGREAGTLDEMRASMWIADELRKIGVAPMGENGSYFQGWNMHRTRPSLGGSPVFAGDRGLRGNVLTATSNAGADVSTTTVFVADPRDTSV